jgi:DeoR/GlpR family transcriptional regulator of sugar metabolism
MSAVPRCARWSTLIELVAAGGHLSVTEAARSLGVYEATSRRDLDRLAETRLSGPRPLVAVF